MAKRIVPIITGLLLICVIIFTGCKPEPEPVPERDVWSRIQSAAEIYGSWEGNTVIYVPEIPLSDILESDPESETPSIIPPSFTLPPSSVDCNIQWTIQADRFDTKETLDFNRYLNETVGLFKDIAWSMMRDFMVELLAANPADENAAITVEDNYRVIVEYGTEEELQFTDETEMYINQHKNKLRIPVEIPDVAAEEIILYRK
ncbi:MAG: hypothetical protein LBG91_05195 [Treponema sp.]|jgi:hypothetical protein|nr:hypothetical protein [Treponema sp.]